jgi:Methyltransferase domain
MGIGMKIFFGILSSAAVYQGGITVRENVERHHYWRVARAFSDLSGKPMLAVGMQRWSWEPPNPEAVVDIDPSVELLDGGTYGDERALPFRDKQFGAVYNAHTLEHLGTAEDVQAAVDECLRVADIACFLAPSPYSITASLFCPAHNLRLWFDSQNNKIVVKKNNWRTWLGPRGGGQYMGQGLLAYEPLRVPLIFDGSRPVSLADL